MSSERVCPVCKGLGYIFTDRGVKKCRCVYENFNLSAYLNIPRRFADADLKKALKNLPREAASSLVYYLKNFPDFYGEGLGLLFFGPTGVGKTYTAAAILKYLYERYKAKGYFADVKELSVKLREHFAEGSHHGFVEFLSKVPLLVLDDLGNETAGEWFREILTGLISARYNSRRVTIFTTNYRPLYLDTALPQGEELKKLGFGVRKRVKLSEFKTDRITEDELSLEKRLGAHLVSRIAEMTFPIPMLGKDRRISKTAL